MKGTKTCSDFHKCFIERQLEFYREILLYFQSSRNNHLFLLSWSNPPPREQTHAEFFKCGDFDQRNPEPYVHFNPVQY